MDIEEFRRHGHEMVERMADYLRDVRDYPVRAQVAPGETAAKLPLTPPTDGEPFEAILEDVDRVVMPGITHWQHPRFFAYFNANSSPPSVLAEMLTATLGAQCMLWQTSPAATEMETRTLDWLRQMIGLPEGFTGVIQDSASSAILCALLTAREKATDWQINRTGFAGAPPLAAYCTAETHSATEKGAKIAGYGVEQVRKVPVDEAFAMRPEVLEEMIEADKAAGIVPACIVASVGATGVGAVDPLEAIGAIARRHGVFLHVDAAWAGSALILPEQRWMIAGIEQADSFVFNPHKWLFTNFDLSAHYVRDPDALIRTFSIQPAFLRSREEGQVIDYRDWGVQLGRRFRALKLWFVIRSYGVERLKAMVAAHIAFAEELETAMRAEPDIELMAPRVLSLLNFRYAPDGVTDEAALDALNERLLTALNDDGFVYLTQNRVGGRYALRFAIGQTYTTAEDVRAGWAHVLKTARALEPA